MLTSYQQNARTKLIATVVSVLIVAGVVVLADHYRSETKTGATATQATMTSAPSTSTATPTTNTPATNSATVATAKTSGTTYSSTSNYYVPHGSESIDVSLTVDNGVITDATIHNSEGDHDSARFQEDFAAAYKMQVVGKKISGLQLDTIAGASDTTQGFNEALSRIAAQVQA